MEEPSCQLRATFSDVFVSLLCPCQSATRIMATFEILPFLFPFCTIIVPCFQKSTLQMFHKPSFSQLWHVYVSIFRAMYSGNVVSHVFDSTFLGQNEDCNTPLVWKRCTSPPLSASLARDYHQTSFCRFCLCCNWTHLSVDYLLNIKRKKSWCFDYFMILQCYTFQHR